MQPTAVESEAATKQQPKRVHLPKAFALSLDDERSWLRHGQSSIVLKLTSRLSAPVHLGATEAEQAAPILGAGR